MKPAALPLILLLTAFAAPAQELVDPVPVLVPIHVGGHLPGAFGTVWATQAHVFNSSPGDVVYFGGGCRLGVICPTFDAVPAGSSYPLTIYPGNPGYLLWVSRADDRYFHVAARMFETSRNTIPGGVAMPVVRDADLRELIAIPAVPKRDGQRYHLRIYGIPAQPTPQAETYLVTVTGWNGDVIQETLVAAHSRTPDSWGNIGPIPFPVVPVFGTAVLDDAVAQAPETSVAVRVRSRSGSRLWAFVAITDNHSQAVSLALPN